jgi:hypothetical protein
VSATRGGRQGSKSAADLSKRLDSQQVALEAAKDEVEANKRWVSCVETVIYIGKSIDVWNEEILNADQFLEDGSSP